MKADEWNEAIAAYFFNEDAAQRRVYLSIDADELARIAALAGAEIADASADFAAAMRSAASNSRDPLYIWRTKYERWRSLPSPRPTPPFLNLLALFVMVAEESTERPGWPFYGPLQEKLRADGPRLREDLEGFELVGLAVVLWSALATWLTDDLEGSRGLSTAQAPRTGIRCLIGHAYSQVVVRRSELDDLAAFFQHVGLDESAQLDPQTGPSWLFRLWRTWVMQGGSTSDRLRRLAAGAESDAADVIGRVLFDELRGPSAGTPPPARPDDKRRVELSLVLDDWEGNELRFGVLIRASLVGLRLSDDDCDFALREAGELFELSLPVTAEALEGFAIHSGDVVLTFRHRPTIAMARRELDVWISVVDPEPGEEVYLFTKGSHGTDAAPRGGVLATRVRNVPEGWLLYRGDTVPGERRVGAAPILAGGLRLRRRHDYLLGGPPSVVVPPGPGTSYRVFLDGVFHTDIGAEGGVVAVPLELGVGLHELRLDPVTLRFTLVAAMPTVAGPYRPHFVRAVTRSDAGEFMDFAARDAEDVTAVPFACGIVLDDGADDPDPGLTPLPGEVLYFGAPGRVEDRAVGAAPWTERAGLPVVGFEYQSRFACRGGRPAGAEFVAWKTHDSQWCLAPLLRPSQPALEDEWALTSWAREVLAIEDSGAVRLGWNNVADREWVRHVEHARKIEADRHG
jgi:hypothetical protein